MTILKTGACFTAELATNCPTIVACVAALPVGAAAVAGDLVLGLDGQYHALPAAPAAAAQAISIAGNVISLTNGGSVTLPTSVAPIPQVLSIAGNDVSLSGGGGTIALPAAAPIVFATPAETVTGTSTTLAVNPADLYARENIAAQTGLGLVLSAIPAPTASQSNWGVNTLGETLHYAPGLGWKIVSDQYTQEIVAANVPLAADVWTTAGNWTAPRAGLVVVTFLSQVTSTNYTTQSGGIYVNSALKAYDNNNIGGNVGAAVGSVFGVGYEGSNSSAAWTGRVSAGDLVQGMGVSIDFPGNIVEGRLSISYIG